MPKYIVTGRDDGNFPLKKATRVRHGNIIVQDDVNAWATQIELLNDCKRTVHFITAIDEDSLETIHLVPTEE